MLKLNDHMLRSSKATLKEMKEARDLRRQSPLTEEEAALLIKESQRAKAIHSQLAKLLRSFNEDAQAKVNQLEQEIEQLRQERKRRSAALQRKLVRAIPNTERPGQGEGLMRAVRSYLTRYAACRSG